MLTLVDGIESVIGLVDGLVLTLVEGILSVTNVALTLVLTLVTGIISVIPTGPILGGGGVVGEVVVIALLNVVVPIFS